MTSFFYQKRNLFYLAPVLTALTLPISAQNSEIENFYYSDKYASHPIWAYEPMAIGLGVITVDPAEPVEVPLNRASDNPVRSILKTTVTDSDGNQVDGFSATSKGSMLTLQWGSDAEPDQSHYHLTSTVMTLEGPEDVHAILEISPSSVLNFTFPFAAEGMPATVAVAGEFNGWNDSANLMEKQADGSLATAMTLKPGTYKYKYVVDGDWVADPTNPEQDASGYNNSVLRVENPYAKGPDLEFLTANEAGTTSWGGLKSDQPIRSAKFILNNNVMPEESIIWSEDRMIIGFDFDPDLKQNENIISALVINDEGVSVAADFRADSGNFGRSPLDEIIYFVMTDRFADGNPDNNPQHDNPELHPSAKYHGGDWQGLTEKIQDGYFKDIGVTTLWISPLTENTMKAESDALPPHRLFTSYHGYWPTSYTKPNPAFGTMDELRNVVSAAHENGIAILADFVANHVHEDHPLFKANPSLATPLDLPDGTQNIREFDKHPLTTWFDSFLPSLDYANNPEARQIAVDAAKYWLLEANLDGFRHDATKHIPVEFWQQTTDMVNDLAPITGKRYYQVGETIGSRDTIMQNVGTDQLDGQFDFPLLFTFVPAVGQGTESFKTLAQSIEDSWNVYPRASIMSPLIGNHDVERFAAKAEPGDLPDGANTKEIGYTNPPQVDDPATYNKLEAAFALLMALPGAPMVYYGDEVGMTGAHDPDNRRPMQFDNLKPEQIALRDAFSSLTKARLNSVALRRGNLKIIHADEDTLILERTSPDESIVFAMMRGAKSSEEFQQAVMPHVKEAGDHWDIHHTADDYHTNVLANKASANDGADGKMYYAYFYKQ